MGIMIKLWLRIIRSRKLFIEQREEIRVELLIGQLNYDSKNPSVIDISSWQQSCDDNNMTLVDAEPGSLIPIYDLVSDMGKKEQLKLAVENYLKEHSYVDIDDSSKGGAVRNNSLGHNTSSYGNSTRVIGANGNRSTYRRP